jgi:hypothetical protein
MVYGRVLRQVTDFIRKSTRLKGIGTMPLDQAQLEELMISNPAEALDFTGNSTRLSGTDAVTN